MRRVTPPFSGSWLRAALLVLVAALLAAPAAGAADDAIPSRPQLYAKALRKDPVYVSPSAVRAVPPADLRRLRRAVAAMPYRTYVLVVPRFTGEPGTVTSEDLLTLTQDRLGRRGLFVLVNPEGTSITALAAGVRPAGDALRASFAATNAVGRDADTGPRTLAALAYLRTGRGDPEYHSIEDSYSTTDAEDVVPWVLMGVAALVTFAVPFALWWRRHVRRRPRRPRRVRDPLSVPERGPARAGALDAIAALAKDLARATDPPPAALRAYDAASHVASDRGATAVDWVGAEALARRGAALLRGRRATPCFFDPRHGAGERPTRFRRGGEEVRIPACRVCAKALDHDLPPVALADRGEPYWQRDTVWARTGFGAIDDRVADVVLAGTGARR